MSTERIVTSNHQNYAETAEKLAAVIEDAHAPEEIVFRLREFIDIRCAEIFERLNTSHPTVIRKLYPVLMEISHDPSSRILIAQE